MSHRRDRRKNAGSKVKKFHSAQRAAGSRYGPREMHPDAISDACVPINTSVRMPVKPGPKLTHLPDGCRRAFSRRFVPPVFSAFQSTQTRHLRKQFFLSCSESHLSGLPPCFCSRSSCCLSLSLSLSLSLCVCLPMISRSGYSRAIISRDERTIVSEQ